MSNSLLANEFLLKSLCLREQIKDFCFILFYFNADFDDILGLLMSEERKEKC